MTKKHFIALADYIKMNNSFDDSQPFTSGQLAVLADFCEAQNGRFDRERWLGYIAGTNGKNGGKVKHVKVLHGLCSVCGHYGDDCTGARERTQGK